MSVLLIFKMNAFFKMHYLANHGNKQLMKSDIFDSCLAKIGEKKTKKNNNIFDSCLD